MKLANRTIILTGASRGLGRVLAHALWSAGASLLLVARSTTLLTTLQHELLSQASSQQTAHVLALDLAQTDAPRTVIDTARHLWQHVDGLINNAAMLGPIGKAWENDWLVWQETVRVNLLAPIELCRLCVPWMIEQGQGKIINLSGGGAATPRENFSAYATSKAALVRFSETLAHEVAHANIQVNTVAPGVMPTDMLNTIARAGREQAGEIEYTRAVQNHSQAETALARAADLCVFLASRESDGITGKLISAVWDPWEELPKHRDDLVRTDIYTLRRIVPKERGKDWG